MENNITPRRQFLKSTAAVGMGFVILPSGTLSGANAPSNKLNVALIGVGGRGRAHQGPISSENVVALCDVDEVRAAESFDEFPEVKRFRDFRQMLDEMDSRIDAVVVSTPDHTHAVAALDAIRRGKHVYCEKPLAHSIGEVRALRKAAREHGVVTQLGNQGHSYDHIRLFCEWIWDGAIGPVHTVHAMRSSDYSRIDELPLLKESHPVPATLDWDLWLGPAAWRPYHPAYLPGSWRGWMPFGTGVLGDWVCHVVDPVFWALDLGAPETVEARAEGYDPAAHADTFPDGTRVTYTFPAKANRGPVTLYWYDGQAQPPRPEGWEGDWPGRSTSAVVLGDKGSIRYGSHGASGVRIFPEESMQAYRRPDPTLPRVKDHYQDWLDAIRGGTQAGSNFDYGGPLTELALLGVIATRLLGTKLRWDAESARFTDSEEANQFVSPSLRDGWTL